MSMIDECRSCGSTELTSILSLGSQYPSNFVELNSVPDEKEQIPLELIFCENQDCGLLQLKHTAYRRQRQMCIRDSFDIHQSLTYEIMFVLVFPYFTLT